MAEKKKAFWETATPKGGSKLSARQKAAAKARASRAGRKYPNLVDNSWASRQPR